MGKFSRRVCSKLLSVYGSPGAILSPPAEESTATHVTTPTSADLLSAVESWRYPADVRQLVTPTRGGNATYENARLGAATCHTIAEALPGLRELRCLCSIAPSPGSSSGGSIRARIKPHTGLTLLQLDVACDDLGPVASFAPNLRALRLRSLSSSFLAQTTGLQPVLSLQGLQHLDLHHFRPCSATIAALTSALLHLTALTHLGMSIMDGSKAVPAAEAQRLMCALASPPLLASIQIMSFRCLGPTLGIALQALGLRHLDLGELDYHPGSHQHLQDAVPSLHGCLPNIGSLPHLEDLRLSGKQVVRSEQLWQPPSAGSASLRALDLGGMQPDTFPHACSMLLHCPMLLTKLIITACRTGDDTTTHDAQLSQALSGFTRLQHLEMDAFGEVPWLTGLPQLSCLKLVCPQGVLGAVPSVVVKANLRLVGRLTSLRKLQFHGNMQLVTTRRVCMKALRGLRLLEEVECSLGKWGEADVLLLLPPPAGLRRVLLRSSESYIGVLWRRGGVLGCDVMEKCESYGVDVFML
jgi:hypothetical protein